MEVSTALKNRNSPDEQDIILSWATTLLKWRRTIVILGVSGGLLGASVGLLSTRKYRSSVTFVPQGSDAGLSGLALAASQFGIRVPPAGGTWGIAMYVELLHSKALLAPITLDTIVVAEEGGRRVRVAELLGVAGTDTGGVIEYGVLALHKVVGVAEAKPIGAVKLSATTKWPSVSFWLAQRLVHAVNEFNLKTRKSQAAAERQFVDARAQDASAALREAEGRLLAFLQRNRDVGGSPELMFERDRLQREVTLRTQIYTSLLQNLEEARMREVRDTPVITVIEPPRYPSVGQPRGTVRKGFLGGLLGGLLGVLIAFTAQAFSSAMRTGSHESREFFRLVSDVTPRFLKRTAN